MSFTSKITEIFGGVDQVFQKRKRIVVLGTSVGLFVRPASHGFEGFNYSALMNLKSNSDLDVTNLCRVSETIYSVLDDLFDRILIFRPDVVILHIGINDCSTRFVPAWLYPGLSGIRLNEGFMSYLIRSRICGLINQTIAPPLIRILKLSPWTDKTKFKTLYTRLIDTIKKETGAIILCIGIIPTTDRVEQLLPGTGKNINLYNQIIREICSIKHCEFIDSSKIFLNAKASTISPDGIHLSFEGHRVLSEILIEMIDSTCLNEILAIG